MIMNKIIEDNNFLTDSQKDMLENVLGQNFPFYYTPSALDGDDIGYMSHTILRRPELRLEGDDGINSKHYDFFKEILISFCQKNKISLNKALRICVNLTLPSLKKSSGVHVDHDFEHKQLILYLTDNEEACTHVLEDDKETVIKSIKPEKYKAVCFSNKFHYVDLPKQKRRVVVVFTFI